MRNSPGVESPVLDQLYRGQTLSVLERGPNNIWVRVMRSDGVTGWVNADYLQITQGDPMTLPGPGRRSETTEAPQVTGVQGKLTSGLNFRTGPGTFYPEMDTLEWGAVVTIVGRNNSNTWYQVQAKGQTGWIFAPYVAIVAGRIGDIPITR